MPTESVVQRLTNGERISLVVCTLSRPEEIKRLLVALSGQSRKPDETLIVDASADSRTSAVAQKFAGAALVPNLRYLKVTEQHRGLTKQRNYGLEHSSGDLIAFLDDDTIPEPSYFCELLACAARNPDAVGIGGSITNEVLWSPSGNTRRSMSVFRWNGWARSEGLRWWLRKCLGLASELPPGFMPTSGHGRPTGYPPDGNDYRVESVMGGVSCWRKSLFEKVKFGMFFAGYGLYEDMDFCIRAGTYGPIYLCSRARVAHYHAQSGRPSQFRYGVMVVRNGWFVWRRRWPAPKLADRCKWWAITVVAALCRMGDALRGPNRGQALADFLGRLYGMLIVWINPPREQLKNN